MLRKRRPSTIRFGFGSAVIQAIALCALPLACSEQPAKQGQHTDGRAQDQGQDADAGPGNDSKPLADGATVDSLTPPPEFDPRAAPLITGDPGETKSIDPSQWKGDSMLWNTSPVDLSFLNHRPAGSHGFVVRDGETLRFEDGTPARFWGGNIAAYAIFQPKPVIEAQAKRLAGLGYNLVRIHHHDSTGWVSPTVIDKSASDTRALDAEGMDALDYWIKCLADEGIYVFLDMHVGRQLKEGDRNTSHGTVETFDEIMKSDGEVKGFAQYDKTVQQLLVEFQEQYLGHENPYRSKAYKDDPAIMGLLVTNENDITHHFGNAALPDKNNPVLNGMFNQARQDFATASGLDADAMFETWLPGESKIFLNNQEHLFNQVMLSSLDAIGVKVPVATTNMWGSNPSFSLPALTDGSLIDVHAYEGEGFLETDPRSEAVNVHWIAAGQVAGFPLSITEWNMTTNDGKPTPDRHAAPMFMASVGALQGWDAPMIYNYSQTAFVKPTKVHGWSTFADPGIQAATPAAALAFRQGHIQPGEQSYCLDLSRDSLYFKDITPNNSVTIRTLAEQSQLRICLPDIPELTWDSASVPSPTAVRIQDHEKDHLPVGKSLVESDTGEIRRYWPLGIQTVNTAWTQAAQGKIGGRTIALGNLTTKVDNAAATVIASALDGQPLGKSGKILLTTVAGVKAVGDAPYASEPLVGTILLRAPAGKTLVPLGADGKPGPAIATTYADGVYTIALSAANFSHWYMLQ